MLVGVKLTAFAYLPAGPVLQKDKTVMTILTSIYLSPAAWPHSGPIIASRSHVFLLHQSSLGAFTSGNRPLAWLELAPSRGPSIAQLIEVQATGLVGNQALNALGLTLSALNFHPNPVPSFSSGPPTIFSAPPSSLPCLPDPLSCLRQGGYQSPSPCLPSQS